MSSQRVAHGVVELAAVDIERRPALARDEREGERQRRMRDVGAADVERPGDVLRIGHHQRVGAQLFQFGADALELVGARSRRRSLRSCSTTRAARRRRAGRARARRSDCARPRPVRRRPWRRPCAASRRRRRCAARDRSRAWRRACRFCSSHCSGGVSTRCSIVKTRGVDLASPPARCSGRRRTARPVGQHDGSAGRAGEAGEPGQPLLARRQIFVLLAVGARHDEAVEARGA